MKDQNIGRLAMRQEGIFWVAYWAHPQTMELAEKLGCIAMATIIDKPARKEAFLRLMTEVAADLIEEITGTRPAMQAPIPGPARERGVRP